MMPAARKILTACLIFSASVVLSACMAEETADLAYKQLPQEKRSAAAEDKSTAPAAPPLDAIKQNTGTPAPQPTQTLGTVAEAKPAAPAPEQKSQAPAVSAEKAAEADQLYEQGFQTYLGGKYDAAVQLFDRAIRTDPNSYKGYNGKGIALCFQGKYEEGMALIQKALELKPDFPYANFNMAMAYKLKKDYDKALEWFNKALSYDPNDAWSYYGISTIYADRNDTAKALEFLKKAVALDPGAKDAAKQQAHYDAMRSNPDFISLVQ